MGEVTKKGTLLCCQVASSQWFYTKQLQSLVLSAIKSPLHACDTGCAQSHSDQAFQDCDTHCVKYKVNVNLLVSQAAEHDEQSRSWAFCLIGEQESASLIM